MLMGISGSGKTTLRNELKNRNKNGCVVSLDDIRKDILDFEHTGQHFEQKIEPEVQKKAINKFKECISQKNGNIIIDATNIKKENRKMYIDMARDNDMEIVVEKMIINPKLAYLRNKKRIENGRNRDVGWDIIVNQFILMNEPSQLISADEFDKLNISIIRPTEEEKEEIKNLKFK
jgi:predicted kinase